VQLLQLAVIAVIAYLAYKAWSTLTNKGGTNCGPNGGQKCCDPSQVNTNNCVGADGNPCGTWEFWTATTCYQGTPSVTIQQIQAARDQSSVWGGAVDYLAPYDTGPAPVAPATLPMQNTLGVAPTVGLPSGYDPITGIIGSGASGAPTAGVPNVPSPLQPICYDPVLGFPTPC
jgi:hypothetical protein